MYKQLTKNVAVTILNNRVHLHLKRYRPIIICAEDRFRKGIEIKLCAKCKTPSIVVMCQGKRDYCSDCALEILTSKVAR